jgi:hypothetical protein
MAKLALLLAALPGVGAYRFMTIGDWGASYTCARCPPASELN